MNTELLLIGSNFITAIAGFFVGKRKQEADTDNSVIRNLELAVNLYGQIIDDLKTEIQSLNIKIQDLEKKIDELHAENKRLKGQL